MTLKTIRDNWPIIIAALLCAVGYGMLKQTVDQTSVAIVEIKTELKEAEVDRNDIADAVTRLDERSQFMAKSIDNLSDMVGQLLDTRQGSLK